jgi:hypothetical protein
VGFGASQEPPDRLSRSGAHNSLLRCRANESCRPPDLYRTKTIEQIAERLRLEKQEFGNELQEWQLRSNAALTGSLPSKPQEIASINGTYGRPVETVHQVLADTLAGRVPSGRKRRRRRVVVNDEQKQRKTIIRTALSKSLQGRKYARELDRLKLKPPSQWTENGCPETYTDAYDHGGRWRHAIQREKSFYSSKSRKNRK